MTRTFKNCLVQQTQLRQWKIACGALRQSSLVLGLAKEVHSCLAIISLQVDSS